MPSPAVCLPVAFVVQLLPIKKTRDRTPEGVAAQLSAFLNGTEGPYDWDDFECGGPFTDPALESIRERAMVAAPPNGDLAALRHLIAECDALAAARASAA
ncbi:MAG: hypothetical protein Q8L59_09910 [Phenylobacterium sp.]|uniref:hypothetical protein n=1 Tax=Phenylobacterium sp. TaxID=1871053 RepID=UPI0027332744|nr:hypothetical protein [Phenylobacterium sp.]MDP1642486.1 hypothetical protein [Phenylobacterium sp.]MDP3118125.1 hypothetical protein [Phenylobacterium sp.]